MGQDQSSQKVVNDIIKESSTTVLSETINNCDSTTVANQFDIMEAGGSIIFRGNYSQIQNVNSTVNCTLDSNTQTNMANDFINNLKNKNSMESSGLFKPGTKVDSDVHNKITEIIDQNITTRKVQEAISNTVANQIRSQKAGGDIIFEGDFTQEQNITSMVESILASEDFTEMLNKIQTDIANDQDVKASGLLSDIAENIKEAVDAVSSTAGELGGAALDAAETAIWSWVLVAIAVILALSGLVYGLVKLGFFSSGSGDALLKQSEYQQEDNTKS